MYTAEGVGVRGLRSGLIKCACKIYYQGHFKLEDGRREEYSEKRRCCKHAIWIAIFGIEHADAGARTAM